MGSIYTVNVLINSFNYKALNLSLAGRRQANWLKAILHWKIKVIYFDTGVFYSFVAWKTFNIVTTFRWSQHLCLPLCNLCNMHEACNMFMCLTYDTGMAFPTLQWTRCSCLCCCALQHLSFTMLCISSIFKRISPYLCFQAQPLLHPHMLTQTSMLDTKCVFGKLLCRVQEGQVGRA